ncbi:MAG: hypothetical protein WBL62_06680 [Gallionella sp.]
MDKTNGAGHMAGQFVAEDLATNRPPTEITAGWLNGVQNELAAVIEASGAVLNRADNQQLLAALRSARLFATAPLADNSRQVATTAFVHQLVPELVNPVVAASLNGVAKVGQLLGVGQAWTDVTANRVVGANYYNTTGKPIMVNVSGLLSSYVSWLYASYLYVDGICTARLTGSGSADWETHYITLSTIVPAGSAYALLGNGFSSWVELR